MRFLQSLYALLAPRDDEPPAWSFSHQQVAQLQRVCPGAPADALDAQTWDDLLVEPYLANLSSQVSIVGRQMLHWRLRFGQSGPDCAAHAQQVQDLMRDAGALERLHRDLRPLRRAEVDVTVTLFEATPAVAPRWLRPVAALLPVALLASIAAVILTPAAWLVTGAVMFTLLSLQMTYHARVQSWLLTLHALRMLLATAAVLGERADAQFAHFAPLARPARALHQRLGRSTVLHALGVSLYADWFALASVTHFFRSAGQVFAQRALLRDCYVACANLEADVALARHLLANQAWCWAERRADDGSTPGITLDAALHPLMQDASALSLALDGQGAFLSGRNGVGKSTFLRTVGINLLSARAFGFCYAARAVLPAGVVYASIRNDDSLFDGESLYVAELRRAKELLAASRLPAGAIFLIDEIFRGTNHLESVSAAAAVLDDLATRALVLVSSHNLVLAPLLAHRLAPWCITRAADGQLVLVPGVLAHTNGVALLAAHDFGAAIEGNAARVCAWLGARQSEPGDASLVLAARPGAAMGDVPA